VAGALQGDAQGALVAGAGAGLAARLYLGALGEVASQARDVLVVNRVYFVHAEGAHLTAWDVAITGTTRAAAGSASRPATRAATAARARAAITSAGARATTAISATATWAWATVAATATGTRAAVTATPTAGGWAATFGAWPRRGGRIIIRFRVLISHLTVLLVDWSASALLLRGAHRD
jgi:hypothetical protein